MIKIDFDEKFKQKIDKTDLILVILFGLLVALLSSFITAGIDYLIYYISKLTPMFLTGMIITPFAIRFIIKRCIKHNHGIYAVFAVVFYIISLILEFIFSISFLYISYGYNLGYGLAHSFSQGMYYLYGLCHPFYLFVLFNSGNQISVLIEGIASALIYMLGIGGLFYFTITLEGNEDYPE